jgi:ureidoglycolate hydrolase
MPLITWEVGERFIIVDRGGPGDNCDEFHFKDADIKLMPI